MRGLGLSDFRDMACTSARGLDSLVHSIVHQRFSGITQFAQVDHLTDFRQRTDVAIQRHEDRQCGCIDRDRLLVVDALTLEAMTPDRFLGPSCTGLAVDRGVYKLMRDYYATVAPVTERVRTELADRCQNGACACYVQGAFRPPIWLPRAA
jgi:hypothetical protein